MRFPLLLKAATAVLLCLPLAASAAVTYSSTGQLFDDVNARIAWDEEPPEVTAERSAAAEAALRLDRVTISFTMATYIPAGWSTFSSTSDIGGPLGTALAGSGAGNSGIDWSVGSSKFSGGGNIGLVFDGTNYDWDFATRISVSVHVDGNHQIDAWQLSMEPGDLLRDFGQHVLTSSSASGDYLLYESTYHRYYEHQEAANAAAGTWSVSGAPVAAVPEASTVLMLLAGLAMVGVTCRRRLAAKAAAAMALCLPLAATADVTYSYTGNLFNSVDATIWFEGDSPETNAANTDAARAALLADNITIGFTSPVYLPTGWSDFSTVGAYSGALGASLQALASAGVNDPGITWNVQNSLFTGNGHISLVFDGPAFDWAYASRLTVSVHADANHQVDAWEISMEPGAVFGFFESAREFTSSSSGGDWLLSTDAGNHYYYYQSGANATPGVWSVSGSPLAVVPEPAGAAMLLAGMAGLAVLRRWRG
jgi:hypothetical protein